MIKYGIVWYGMVRYGMVWYGMDLAKMSVLLARSLRCRLVPEHQVNILVIHHLRWRTILDSHAPKQVIEIGRSLFKQLPMTLFRRTQPKRFFRCSPSFSFQFQQRYSLSIIYTSFFNHSVGPEIVEEQFGIITGQGTSDTMLLMRNLIENYGEKATD